METIIAFAACSLLAVQIHRNYLMVKASKRSSLAPIVVNVQVPEIEIPRPVVTTVVHEDKELDYRKLGDSIKKALIESGVALHNAQLPVVVPVPPQLPVYPNTPPYPIINEVTTSNEVEINGYKAKKFPAS